MTLRFRNAKTGENEAIFRNVKHFQICSTGATPNGKTCFISRRYDCDESFQYEMGAGVFLCIEE